MTQPPPEAWVGAMVRHLPPSGAALRLLDVNGRSGAILTRARPDLEVRAMAEDFGKEPGLAEASDAIAIYDQALTPALLDASLHQLRPGGRLIAVLPHEQTHESWVQLLEGHGYIRILVEPALEADNPGVLVRGEKPHTTADTLARIRVASSQDDTLTDLTHYPGRFIYLLVRQMPNKPAWALREGEQIAWNAVVTDGQSFIAFSSLAKAVAFMQPAILARQIRDINKVAKFRVETVRAWNCGIVLNPAEGYLAGRPYALQPIDPAKAEAPDE